MATSLLAPQTLVLWMASSLFLGQVEAVGTAEPEDSSPVEAALRSADVQALREALREISPESRPASGPTQPDWQSLRIGPDLVSPLHFAVLAIYRAPEPKAEAIEIARLLVEHGADPHLHSTSGDTPFSLAKDRGDATLLDLLTARQIAGEPVAFYGREEFQPTAPDKPLIRAFKAGRLATGNFAQLPIFAARPKPGDVIADIGCGRGPHIDVFLEMIGPSGQVIARDINQASIDIVIARRLDRVDALRSERADVAIAEENVDVAILAEVWNGIISQPTRSDFVRSLFRAMKPGGVVVITLYGRNGSWSRPDYVEEALQVFGAAGFEPGQRLNVRSRNPRGNPNYVLYFRRPR